MEIENGTIHGKRVRFHCLRKFLIDRLSAYAGESQWKQIVGKSIDEGAYVSQDQLKGVFQRAMKDLLINGNGVKAKKLIELENALVDSQRRIKSLETTNETLREKMQRLEQRLTENNLSIDKKLAFLDSRLTTIEETERKKPEKVKVD
jgi:predicted  nucleic acid-binding Zn-ribbon protein